MLSLQSFIETYDRPGSIVLLEGKRTVLDEDKIKLVEIGRVITSKTKFITFRSGNAAGADYHFSEGVISVDPSRLQVIIPFQKHRHKDNLSYKTISLDQINLLREPEVIYQSRFNKKTAGLIDKYVSGDINRFTIKASYIIRDTVKVLGAKDIQAASFGIFYDNLFATKMGGTGHTMNICQLNGIKFIDQTTWMYWLL